MSILKSTNSGKENFWRNILEGKHYVIVKIEIVRNKGKECFRYRFKYPFTVQAEDCFTLSENGDLFTLINHNFNSYSVKILNKEQLELCEWYWEAKHNNIFGSESDEKVIELAKEILKK